MDFPITDLLDEQACQDWLVGWLHPDGMACPRCHQPDRMVVHRRGRGPVLDFRCDHCHRVFNAFTGTALHGNKRRPPRTGPDPPRLRPECPHRPTGL